MSAPREVLVVGGGVIGLALAFELLESGLQVRVLERDRPAGGATDAAAGMLAPVSEAEVEIPEQVALGRDSLRRYPGFVERVERVSGQRCEYRSDGTWWVAANRDDMEELEHLAAALEAKRLPHERLAREQVLAGEPHLSSRVLGGLRVVSDHQVDPRALCRSLRLAVDTLGGRLDVGVEVEEVLASAGRVRGLRARSADGRPIELAGTQVVLCAGAWLDRLSLPVDRFGVRPVKGQLLRLRGPQVLRRVVRTPDVYLVPRAGGDLLVGGTVEEMGFDTDPTAGAAMDLLRHAWEVLPAVYDLALAEVSVGLRPAAADHLPLIGGAGIEGLWVAGGHYRSGILLAPATAHYLARAIVEQRIPDELASFDPTRLWSLQARAAAEPPAARGGSAGP